MVAIDSGIKTSQSPTRLPLDMNTQAVPIVTGAAFAASSIGMILVNKGAMVLFPYSGLLLLLQTFATVIFLICNDPNILKRWDWRVALRWLPCCLLFCSNLVTSLQALKHIGVPTFTVLRNTQPGFTLILEYFSNGRKTSAASFCWLVLIFVGSGLYAFEDITFNVHGYFWSALHILSMSMYLVFVKMTGQTLGLDATTMSLYSNVLALPVFTILSATGITEQTSSLDSWRSALQSLQELRCLLVVILSCVGGFCVSVTAFRAQRAMSPTSFVTLNNVSKVPALLLSAAIFGGSFSSLMLCGMSLSLLGGYLYSMSVCTTAPPPPVTPTSSSDHDGDKKKL